MAALPGVSLSSVSTQLRVGSFLRPLPAVRRDVARFAMTMLGLAMQVEPAWLDRPPRCETAFGEVPVLLIERCQALERLAAHPEGRGGDDGRLMQAALMLDEHLRVSAGPQAPRAAAHDRSDAPSARTATAPRARSRARSMLAQPRLGCRTCQTNTHNRGLCNPIIRTINQLPFGLYGCCRRTAIRQIGPS